MKLAERLKRDKESGRTYGMKEWQRDWLLAFRAAGHIPIKVDGRVDYFAYNPADPHNGPACVKCGEGWCWHCSHPADVIDRKCGGRAHKIKVKREAEDRVIAEANEILSRRRKRASLRARGNPK